MEKIYFRGVNAIRAWAAIFVIWWHLEEYKGHFQITNRSEDEWFFFARYGMAGNDAVLVFFVLSGFLITYLLLIEIKRDGQINIPKFYLRRTLRIWPVYYVSLVIGFVLIPIVVKLTNFEGFYTSVSNGFFEKFLLFFFFLPNVAHALRIFPIGLMHLWTIGVEEAFYLFWPQILQHFRRCIMTAIGILLASRLLILWLIAVFITEENSTKLEGFNLLLIILSKYPFEGMAIGALGAYLLFDGKAAIFSVVFHPVVKWLSFILLLVNISFIRITPMIEYLGIFTQPIFACLYIIFILNIVHDKNFLTHFDAPIYDFLGNLSYGIYMYHMFVIYCMLIFFDKIQWTDNNIVFNLLSYSIATSLTIGLAYISYRWLETPFLNLKKKFQTLETVTNRTESEPS